MSQFTTEGGSNATPRTQVAVQSTEEEARCPIIHSGIHHVINLGQDFRSVSHSAAVMP